VVVLWLLFIVTSFVMLIHLLNMLIAIMGESFSQNNEVRVIQQIRSHLRFVLGNLHVNPLQNVESITYLITSWHRDDNIEDEEQLKNIQRDLAEM
jgi:DNA recombination-dependent growth factor C